MLSEQEEQEERRRVTLQDADLRRQQQEQATTFHQHAQSQAADISGGRFAATGVPNVTGATPGVQYPQLPSSSPWSGAQPEPGIEPRLGFDNPALGENSAGVGPAPAATGPAEAPSSFPSASDLSEHAAGPPSSEQSDE